MIRTHINPFVLNFTIDDNNGNWTILLNGKKFRKFDSYEKMIECLKSMR